MFFSEKWKMVKIRIDFLIQMLYVFDKGLYKPSLESAKNLNQPAEFPKLTLFLKAMPQLKITKKNQDNIYGLKMQ